MHHLRRSIRRRREALTPHGLDILRIVLDALSRRRISLFLPSFILLLLLGLLSVAVFQSDPILAVNQVFNICAGLLVVAILVIPAVIFLLELRRPHSIKEQEESRLRQIWRKREQRRQRHHTGPVRTESRLERGDPFHLSDEGEIIFDGKSLQPRSPSEEDESAGSHA